MFNFLKNKLKSVVESFTKKAESEIKDITPEPVSETKIPETPKPATSQEKAPAQVMTEGPKREDLKEVPEKEEIKEAPAVQKPEDDVFEVELKDTISEKVSEDISNASASAKIEKVFDFQESLEEVRAELKKAADELAEEEKKPKGMMARMFAKKEEKKEVKAPEERKGIFERLASVVTTTKISQQKFEELFEEMEIVLLENNVAVEVIDKIKDDLKTNIVDKPIPRGKVESIVSGSLKASITSLFEAEQIDLLDRVRTKHPYIILFAGINGSGKTTSIAKIANLLQNNKLKVVMAAADTFRAAAIQQLQEHADRLGVKLIKHDYGADPAAVAFDAIKYAQAKDMDVVLIDTAGRQHSNSNLMDEMKKVVRVSKPDMKIFVGESITGNDCVEQAKHFNEAIGIDGIILSKADVDEKGGAAISVSYVTKKPIIYLGTGQNYSDITPFKPKLVVESLGLVA